MVFYDHHQAEVPKDGQDKSIPECENLETHWISYFYILVRKVWMKTPKI